MNTINGRISEPDARRANGGGRAVVRFARRRQGDRVGAGQRETMTREVHLLYLPRGA